MLPVTVNINIMKMEIGCMLLVKCKKIFPIKIYGGRPSLVLGLQNINILAHSPNKNVWSLHAFSMFNTSKLPPTLTSYS